MTTIEITNPALLRAAVQGLTQHPKAMEPKWFYDEPGSVLFEQITELPEYYPTRTELAILRTQMETLAHYVPAGAELVELGSGASTKTRLLLDRFTSLSAYVPIDISADFLNATAKALNAQYPDLRITPVVGDFSRGLSLPAPGGPRVAFFPGSTIGNLDDDAASALLSHVCSWAGIHAFVIGVDLVKDPAVLKSAYDDAAGVTAAFNLNLLSRMNREIGTDFAVSQFAHRAVWNAEKSRIEMHLVSLQEQTVRLGEREIALAEGETIHTENSRKFTRASVEQLAGAAGWRIDAFLCDEMEAFAVAVLLPA